MHWQRRLFVPCLTLLLIVVFVSISVILKRITQESIIDGTMYDRAYAIAWNNAENIIVVGGFSVQFHNQEGDLQDTLTVDLRLGRVTTIQWSEDSQLLGIVQEHGMQVFSITQSTPIRLIPIQNASAVLQSVTWSHDGKQIALGTSQSTLQVVDMVNNRIQYARAVGAGELDGIVKVVYVASGNQLLCVTQRGTVAIYDAKTGIEVLNFKLDIGDSDVISASYSQSNNALLIGTYSGELLFSDLSFWAVSKMSVPDRSIQWVGWNRDGKLAAYLSDGGEIQVLRCENVHTISDCVSLTSILSTVPIEAVAWGVQSDRLVFIDASERIGMSERVD